MLARFLYISHIITLFIIAAILSLAFYFQLTDHELPCPLCLMQRLGFLFIAFGFLLNLRFGYYPSHYAISLLGAVYTIIVSALQILLHILPGDPGYGATFLTLHFYTLAFIAATGFAILSSVLLLIDSQFTSTLKFNLSLPTLWVFLTLFLFLIIANGISTFLECELSLCPSNPVQYEFLSRGSAGSRGDSWSF